MHIYVLLQQFFDIDVFSLPSFSGHLLMRVIFCEEKKSHLTSTSVKVIMASLNNKHIQIATDTRDVPLFCNIFRFESYVTSYVHL